MQQFGVRGFPTIKYFGPNKSSPSDYDSARDSAAIVTFAMSKWEKYAPAAEVRRAWQRAPLSPPSPYEYRCYSSPDNIITIRHDHIIQAPNCPHLLKYVGIMIELDFAASK